MIAPPLVYRGCAVELEQISDYAADLERFKLRYVPVNVTINTKATQYEPASHIALSSTQFSSSYHIPNFKRNYTSSCRGLSQNAISSMVICCFRTVPPLTGDIYALDASIMKTSVIGSHYTSTCTAFETLVLWFPALSWVLYTNLLDICLFCWMSAVSVKRTLGDKYSTP